MENTRAVREVTGFQNSPFSDKQVIGLVRKLKFLNKRLIKIFS
jgi:hypothetical protein